MPLQAQPRRNLLPPPHAEAFTVALFVFAIPWLSGCDSGDDWYDGTANMTAEVYVDAAPPKISTTQSAIAVKFRTDMGGETLTLYVGANAPCIIWPDGFSEEQPRPLSLSSSFTCTFDEVWEKGPSTLTVGKGSLTAEESLSLDLTFSPKPDPAVTTLFTSTLRLLFEGQARASD